MSNSLGRMALAVFLLHFSEFVQWNETVYFVVTALSWEQEMKWSFDVRFDEALVRPTHQAISLVQVKSSK